jgi:hypothetical protein
MLIVMGVFASRPAIKEYWDCGSGVEIDAARSVRRGIERDVELVRERQGERRRPQIPVPNGCRTGECAPSMMVNPTFVVDVICSYRAFDGRRLVRRSGLI